MIPQGAFVDQVYHQGPPNCPHCREQYLSVTSPKIKSQNWNGAGGGTPGDHGDELVQTGPICHNNAPAQPVSSLCGEEIIGIGRVNNFSSHFISGNSDEFDWYFGSSRSGREGSGGGNSSVPPVERDEWLVVRSAVVVAPTRRVSPRDLV